MMNWETLLSAKRFGSKSKHSNTGDHRTEIQRDYDRLIFSSPFKRLQNKTQVFPLPGSIFVHNRLTHSLEVASVGRSLGNNISKYLHKKEEIQNPLVSEIGSIVSAACLAHDLGNPPFGHFGETAISSYFTEGNGLKYKDHVINGQQLTEQEWLDFINFEGNANTFRLLTHQFEGRREGGFALTYSTLASVVKYPYSSVLAEKKSKFGFFISEEEHFKKIASELGLIKNSSSPLSYCRHPLVYLVEAADDICYQIMDIEDSHKLKILSSEETKELLLSFIYEERVNEAKNRLQGIKDLNEQIAYLRAIAINNLTEACTAVFISHEASILKGDFEGSLTDHLDSRLGKAYTKSKQLAFKKIYQSTKVADVEIAGHKIITTLLELMLEAVNSPEKAYSKLLLNVIPDQYNTKSPKLYDRIQAILDYVSGMTDVYALDLYRKINGNDLPAV